jgi:hypothetical protein
MEKVTLCGCTAPIAMKTGTRTLIHPFLAALGIFTACSSIFAPDAYAGPIQYNITFTTGSGIAPTAGSFLYDSAAPLGSRFSSFSVTWDAAIFDLSASANNPSIDFVGGACSDDAFSLMSGTACTAHALGVPEWLGSTSYFGPSDPVSFEFFDEDVFAADRTMIVDRTARGPASESGRGGWTVAPSGTPVPEPGSLILALGGGGSLLYRKLRSPATKRTRPTDQNHVKPDGISKR